jgi:hypothetical protein
MRLDDETLCDELLSELGEDVVILRHDVDNIYGIYRPGKTTKLLKMVNYGFMALLGIVSQLRYFIPGYEEHIPPLLDIERAYDARATFFFRPITVPQQDLLSKLKIEGHELAYHSDRNNSFEEWYKDLKYVEKTESFSKIWKLWERSAVPKYCEPAVKL